MKKYNKLYHQKNRAKLLDKMIIYRKNHLKERNEYDRRYKKEHKEHAKQIRKIYLQKNKKRLQEYMKNYYRLHKKERFEYKRKWLKNPINRLITRYRSRIYHALKGHSKGKSSKELLGCSIEFLKSHLEKKFKKGMSWSNYGLWHVDHIKQCHTFDLRKKNEQLKCFNYKNLRPLWAEDNWSRTKNEEV
jgi:hypothetical protein